MRSVNLLFASLAIVVSVLCAAPLLADGSAWPTLGAPSCSWTTNQADGSSFGVCVGDDGRRFCVSCPAGTTQSADCPQVTCS